MGTNIQEPQKLTDQELLDKAKKTKSNNTIHAIFIGFLIGIVIYSMVANKWGFVTLLPLFLAYKLMVNPPKDKDLK